MLIEVLNRSGLRNQSKKDTRMLEGTLILISKIIMSNLMGGKRGILREDMTNAKRIDMETVSYRNIFNVKFGNMSESTVCNPTFTIRQLSQYL